MEVLMSDYQKEIYHEIYREETRRGRGNFASDSFSIQSRQVSNFVFPNIDQYINGTNRPREDKLPGENTLQFLYKKYSSNPLLSHKIRSEILTDYQKMLAIYTQATDDFFLSLIKEDRKAKNSIVSDLRKFSSVYKEDWDKFVSDAKNGKMSRLLQEFVKLSPKITRIIVNIDKSPGPVIVYSALRNMA